MFGLYLINMGEWKLTENEKLMQEAQERIPQYEFRSVLGSGGIGIVFEVKPRPDSKIYSAHNGVYALKTRKHKDNNDFILRDLESLGKFDHPNIPLLYDFNKDNFPWYVTDKLRGFGTISQSPLFVLHIAKHISNVLFYLADCGYSHNDVKPRNFMLKEEKVILNDFDMLMPLEGPFSGLKRLFRTVMRTKRGDSVAGEWFGTIGYIPPEILRYNNPGMHFDGEVATRSYSTERDVYAFGLSLESMLTGESPYSWLIEDKVLRMNSEIRKIAMEEESMSDSTIKKVEEIGVILAADVKRMFPFRGTDYDKLKDSEHSDITHTILEITQECILPASERISLEVLCQRFSDLHEKYKSEVNSFLEQTKESPQKLYVFVRRKKQ